MTLGDALKLAQEQLLAAGTPSPRLNAEVLLQRLLRVEKVFLFTHPERRLTAEEEKNFFDWVRRRAGGEPAQYITGHQEFWGMDFEVTPAVLIPRPETEHVVETVVKLNTAAAPRIVDVGTGSGCIAVALAREIPRAEIRAVDLSKDALQVAARNAEAHGVCGHIEFHLGDLLSPFGLDGYREYFDFIVSNPPYVPRDERQSLPREVRAFEPAAALHAGSDDPIEIYRRLRDQALPRLRPRGHLIAELGAGQDAAIGNLFAPPNWNPPHFINDLQSLPRVVAVQKR